MEENTPVVETVDVVDNTDLAENPKGAFYESLVRNNAKIRRDRATAIFEQAQTHYRRRVEDIELDIKQMKRERENMLDLSPTNAMSLMIANDFNAKAFVDKDLELGIRIRNEEIKLDIARKQYTRLFQ